jgi:hypothetical protein
MGNRVAAIGTFGGIGGETAKSGIKPPPPESRSEVREEDSELISVFAIPPNPDDPQSESGGRLGGVEAGEGLPPEEVGEEGVSARV